MKKMMHHPLHAQECALKRAFVLSGFELFDDSRSQEVVSPEWNIALSKVPLPAPIKPIMLEQGYYTLRTDLLSAQLSKLKRPLPLKAFASGVVYDANKTDRPNSRHLQGVWADERVPTRLWLKVWDSVVREAFGLQASFSMTPLSKDAHRIDVQLEGKTFKLGTIARATKVAYALLGLDDSSSTMWFFDVNIDEVASGAYGLESPDALYSQLVQDLTSFEDSQPSYGNFFLDRATDLLRKRNFTQFYGTRLYDKDCYTRMHMIQEGWDKNNDGMRLVEPLGDGVWLPTVLTPSIEDALATNYAAGEESCRVFEVGHVFVPYSDADKDYRERSKNKKYDAERGPRAQTDKPHHEKIVLAFAAYGPDLNEEKWVDLVAGFLDDFGIKEHYFLKTMQAIAYKTLDCRIVFNDKMRFLMANFGSIHSQALANQGIEVPAFMANFEFDPIEQEAAWEMIFVPVEYR